MQKVFSTQVLAPDYGSWFYQSSIGVLKHLVYVGLLEPFQQRVRDSVKGGK
jgi:hypothetical protein